MDCPKCGFQQPLDEFCAHCGINIHEALKRRQRRNLLALLACLILVVSGALAINSRLSKDDEIQGSSARSVPQVRPTLRRVGPPPAVTPRPAKGESQPTTDKAVVLPAFREEPEAAKAPPQSLATAREPEVPSGQGTYSGPPSQRPSEVLRPPSGAPAPESRLPESPQESESTEPDPERQIQRWAAQEWFAKGQELADNSEEELAFYAKALEVDPQFSPAHYYIGIIHLELGNREAALPAFRRFWKYATPDEREKYPLPESISLDELGIAVQGE